MLKSLVDCMQTQEGQKALRAETEKMKAEARARREKGVTPAPVRSWQYANSNFGMGF